MVDPTDNPWRPVLYARFRGQPTPMLVLPDALWTAASLWAGTRAWAKSFRESGLMPGDVIACALPAGSGFVQVLLACLWDGITFIPVGPPYGVTDALRLQKPSAEVSIGSGADDARDWPVFVPDSASQPRGAVSGVRRDETRARGSAVTFLGPDGEQGATTSLTAHDLLAAAEAHAVAVDLAGGCVMTVMPWHTPTELVYGLLASLLVADEIVRVPESDSLLRGAIELAEEHPITHVNLLASTAGEWMREPAGSALLMRVKGAAVSGAETSSAEVTSALERTKLRMVDWRVG